MNAAGSPVDWDSRRLWSLWEMIRFDASGFVWLAKEMKRLSTFLSNLETFELRTEEQKKNDIATISSFRNTLEASWFVLSCDQIDRIIYECRPDSIISNEDLAHLVDDLSTRMEDECKRIVFLALSHRDAQYFSPEIPIFGVDYSTKFVTEGVFEADEAAKCLALGRPTAAVFHLMRVMEVGIKAMSRCLAIPDPIKPVDRNWGRILEKIQKEGIQKHWPNVSDRTHGDGALFEELYVSLEAVRNPWRNATMHVENKYTDDEAEHILVAVRGFMKKLASRCDENGQPLAPLLILPSSA
jgi:hypothetical protein